MANKQRRSSHLFDLCPLENFQKGRWNTSQTARSLLVKEWVAKHSMLLRHIKTLEWENVDLDTIEGQKRFVELINLPWKVDMKE